MPYTIEPSTDGTDETFDIIGPTGERLASVPYWDDREGAEAVASRVADIFNTLYPSKTAT